MSEQVRMCGDRHWQGFSCDRPLGHSLEHADGLAARWIDEDLCWRSAPTREADRVERGRVGGES